MSQLIRHDVLPRPSNFWDPAHILRAQRDAFKLGLAGGSLDEVLNLIVRRAAIHTSGRAAIFLVDEAGAFLRFSAASGLPESYTRAVDGFLIGPSSPSCGKAAYTGERVIVSDVREDPLWSPFLALAKEHGIRACWSTPIRSFDGEVLGTLAVYHAAPRARDVRHLDLIDLLADTASILIGRARAESGREAAMELARSNALAAQEMSHRIMNSFQVLQSLINMQVTTTQARQVRVALNSVSARVQAMAVMHRLLLKGQRENNDTIDLAEYLPQLIKSFGAAFLGSNSFTLEVDVSPGARLPADQVSALGLIATELVMNALKHSSPRNRPCHISVSLQDTDGFYHFAVSDDGVGLPPQDEITVVKGLGAKLINTLARQLRGAVEIDRTPPGVRFVLTFPRV
jgi:two-component sensor histidine kinase